MESNQWQPIETAPRDGTPVMLCHARHYARDGWFPSAASFRTYHPNAPGKSDWRDMSNPAELIKVIFGSLIRQDSPPEFIQHVSASIDAGLGINSMPVFQSLMKG